MNTIRIGVNYQVTNFFFIIIFNSSQNLMKSCFLLTLQILKFKCKVRYYKGRVLNVTLTPGLKFSKILLIICKAESNICRLNLSSFFTDSFKILNAVPKMIRFNSTNSFFWKSFLFILSKIEIE